MPDDPAVLPSVTSACTPKRPSLVGAAAGALGSTGCTAQLPGDVASGLSAPGGAMAIAIAALIVTAIAITAYRRDPHNALRRLTRLLIRSFYRLRTHGLEHVPASGAAVLVCNHVSFVDSLIIMAAVRRPIRFVIDHRIYETPIANTLFRHSRTIPIAPAREKPGQKEAAFAEVAKALREGELIGLFPEGGITHSGQLEHFRYGVGRIVSETPVPVIPMALRGLWGSFFSRRHGAAMSRPSALRWRAPIELVAGPAVAARSVTPEYLQQIVERLRGDRL